MVRRIERPAHDRPYSVKLAPNSALGRRSGPRLPIHGYLVLTVTRLDRLARSTPDLLNTLGAITAKKAGFRSLGDAWADTTTAHGRLMLTFLGGLAEFERDPIRARTGKGREQRRPVVSTSARSRSWPAPVARGDSPARRARQDPR